MPALSNAWDNGRGSSITEKNRPAHFESGDSYFLKDEGDSDETSRAEFEKERICKSPVHGAVVISTPEFSIRFVLASLATWRVTHLLAREDGPADLIVHFRMRLGSTLAGTLMDCFQCLSLWVATLAALFVTHNFLEWLFTWLALSGAACLLERIGQEPIEIQPNPEPEGETSHVLRSETIDSADPLNAIHALNFSEDAGAQPGRQNE